MKTLVVGDIHGCYASLLGLFKILNHRIIDFSQDRIIFLGDYIDRGNDPAKTVEFVRGLQKRNPNVIPLLGNHEQMLIDYLERGDETWFFNGAKQTLLSYAAHDDELSSAAQWMKTLSPYYEDENNIYVHAGIRPEVPMKAQNKNDMLWIRDSFLDAESTGKKRVIFGHTPSISYWGKTQPYLTWAGNLGLDTGCVFGGRLSALVIFENKKETVFQY